MHFEGLQVSISSLFFKISRQEIPNSFRGGEETIVIFLCLTYKIGKNIFIS
eukprot:UN15293